MIAFPRPLLEYVREAFIVGLLTTRGSGHESRRSLSIALLISLAIGEAYWLYTVPISLRENSDIVFMVRPSFASPTNRRKYSLPGVGHSGTISSGSSATSSSSPSCPSCTSSRQTHPRRR